MEWNEQPTWLLLVVVFVAGRLLAGGPLLLVHLLGAALLRLSFVLLCRFRCRDRVRFEVGDELIPIIDDATCLLVHEPQRVFVAAIIRLVESVTRLAVDIVLSPVTQNNQT